MDCHFSIWGVLAFLSLALLVSLTLNIVHCIKKKQAKMHKDYEESNPSYDGYHTEDDPVYGNLNQDVIGSPPNHSKITPIEVESANQMCYASLDHSVKRKCRKPRRKKDPSLEEDEEERSSNPMVASKVSIYLNSEQLAAENTAKVEAIHDDPIRLMGLIHNAKGEN
ncbi:T-cell receptor-associated transmembrane adapter 1 [Lonchura striata]|nr:T-cell receptor-associated transmembrane adapter 1 [Lonchura striata domestica]